MKPNRSLLPPLALPLGSTLVLLGLTFWAWCNHSEAWLTGGLLLAAVALASAAPWYLASRQLHRAREARQYIDLLCRRENSEDSVGASYDSLPRIVKGSPWADSLHQMEQRLSAAASKLAEAEHARASLEIRYRRGAVQSERVAQIVNGMSEPVLAVDRYDELLLANPSAQRLLGVGTDQQAEQVMSQLDRCERLVALLQDTRKRKLRTSRTEEVEIEDTTGQRRWYSVTASGIGDENDGVADEAGDGVVAVFRDISGQKEIRRQHAEFVSAVSHEMKTPLAGIKAYVELLADGDAEDEATREEFLEVINSQADRLQRLIDNLLNLARIEAGVVKVSKEPQGLNEILQEAVGVVLPSADAKQIKLAAELSPMYLGALVDRDMMLQAAINLLSNAVKYTTASGKVTLRSRMLAGEVQFEVEDTGVGLSPEDCDRVFSKFYRVERQKGMASGTGLGLPLARHIVEDVHGGKLSVTSKLDVGSTFSVTIPSHARNG